MKTPTCLLYAGVLGHTWIVTATRPGNDYESIYCQTSSGDYAAKAFDENKHSTAIYQRTKKGWKKVPYSLAMIS